MRGGGREICVCGWRRKGRDVGVRGSDGLGPFGSLVQSTRRSLVGGTNNNNHFWGLCLALTGLVGVGVDCWRKNLVCVGFWETSLFFASVWCGFCGGGWLGGWGGSVRRGRGGDGCDIRGERGVL